VRQPSRCWRRRAWTSASLYIFALGGIAVYGVVLGGWASNNKFSFLGGLRSSAQLIGYEIPLGLGILGVVAAAGSLRLDAIIRQQATSGLWNAFTQPLGLMVFAVAAFAEGRPPPLRPPRGRARTGRRLPHRILRREAAFVSRGRIRSHDCRGDADRRSFPRRVALLGAERLGRNDLLDDGAAARRDPDGEDAGGDILLHARPLEAGRGSASIN